MKKSLGRVLGLVIISSSFVGAVAAGVYAGNVRQFAAEFLKYEGVKEGTTLAPSTGGKTIYESTVVVPQDIKTLEVTIFAAGDLLDNGNRVSNLLWLNCKVDGNLCNRGVTSAGKGVAGWVPVLSLGAGTEISGPTPTLTTRIGVLDSNIRYRWCMPIEPKKDAADPLTHNVELTMASGDGTHAVYIEQLLVFVDGTSFGGLSNKSDACAPAPVPTPVP
jgi:hypothetical protein